MLILRLGTDFNQFKFSALFKPGLWAQTRTGTKPNNKYTANVVLLHSKEDLVRINQVFSQTWKTTKYFYIIYFAIKCI